MSHKVRSPPAAAKGQPFALQVNGRASIEKTGEVSPVAYRKVSKQKSPPQAGTKPVYGGDFFVHLLTNPLTSKFVP